MRKMPLPVIPSILQKEAAMIPQSVRDQIRKDAEEKHPGRWLYNRDLRKAHIEAAEAMWIKCNWTPVTKESQPPENSTVVYWHKPWSNTGSGWPAIADEWNWQDHGAYASHYLPSSITPPSPHE